VDKSAIWVRAPISKATNVLLVVVIEQTRLCVTFSALVGAYRAAPLVIMLVDYSIIEMK
jgi:hypothetical protein